ncbi:MAG: hypothetical protein JXR76_31220 [Deltaproteobacteria bacterium]|nr:hypothetical protein [Deltaproteobacteria bacterium]
MQDYKYLKHAALNVLENYSENPNSMPLNLNTCLQEWNVLTGDAMNEPPPEFADKFNEVVQELIEKQMIREIQSGSKESGSSGGSYRLA